MRRRRAITILIGFIVAMAALGSALPVMVQETIESFSEAPAAQPQPVETPRAPAQGSAIAALETLEVKGRAPKTGYERTQFGNGWTKVNGCSTRDIILNRDIENVVRDGECSVASGTLTDVYTGEIITFTKQHSSVVQIDHVVALSDAWQKGAQQLSLEQRKQLANDPLELIAVSGRANQEKGDGDAASWLPKNKQFRCGYVARQIAVKVKYSLWVTLAEKTAMADVLQSCPSQVLP